jgi:basic membrane protein A
MIAERPSKGTQPKARGAMTVRTIPVMLAVIGAFCVGGLGAGAHATPKTLRVGLVIAVGPNPGADADLRQLFLGDVKRLGVTGRVVYLPPSFVATGALTTLAREHYDLIVTGCNVDPAFVGPVAARYPGSRFLMPCFTYAVLGRKARNVEGWFFRSEEASYLAGYLAVRMESRRGAKPVISSVGGYKVDQVDAFIAGYEAGARRADPGVQTLHGYAQSFNDLAKCRSVATAQIAQGAGVVFGVAGVCSLGALQAAKAKHAWGIGVDTDQSALGSFILTSVLKHFDVGLFDAIRSLTRGQLRTGGDEVFNLRNEGVGLGRISPKVPASLRREVSAIKEKIVSGTIRVPSTLR